MKKLFLIPLLFISLNILGQIPAGYYDNAQGLTGYQLKTALKTIITNGYHSYSYDDLYTIYQRSDVDTYFENDGTILDMYSEIPSGPDSYEYSTTSQHCGQYSHEGQCYNREHIMPQSVFGSASPMKSDAHFVVPTDGYVNNRRSAYPFGEVSNPTWTSTNGSKVGSNTTQGYSGTVFEPIDEFKGDIARMLFYFATRYEDQVDGWNHDMLNGTSNQVYTDWFLSILLAWHNQDPVNQREIDRNNAIYYGDVHGDYAQENRNPFIDHPEWVNAIWNPTPDTQAPSIPMNILANNIQSNTVDIQWDAATDNVGVTAYQVFQDNNFIGESLITSMHVSGLQAQTTYSFCVKAKDAAGNISACSADVQVTTTAAPTYVFYEDFEDCSNLNFIAYNEASNKDWTCITSNGDNDTGAMQVNGYQEDVASKDWLITLDAINFDNYSNESLSMYLNYTYGTTPLELLYSSDYDGLSNPSGFTWTAVPNVNIDTPTGSTSETVQQIQNVDVSSIGGMVYLAFKYYSNGSPTRWTVDSFIIDGDLNGIDNVFLSQNILIYPNPVHSSGSLHIIRRNNVQIENIKLYNIFGQIISLPNNANMDEIYLSNIKKGIYFLEINTQQAHIMKKIIVD